MFATVTNRGSQIGLFAASDEAEAAADEINEAGTEVFAWVVPAPANARVEDAICRGFVCD